MLNAIDVVAHYSEILVTRGKEEADHYMECVDAIERFRNKPSAKLVDSAIHMANTEYALRAVFPAKN